MMSSNTSVFSFSFLVNLLLCITTSTSTQLFGIDEDMNCDAVISIDEGKTGIIETFGYPQPYPESQLCETKLLGNSKHRVLVEFEDFYLFHPQGREHQKNTSCDGLDTLRVYDGIGKKAALLGAYCGRLQPLPVMSSGKHLTLTMTSYSSGFDAKGYRAKYSFVTNFGITDGFQSAKGNCTFIYNSAKKHSGEISSPNPKGMYPRNTVCSYTFDGKGKERVLLKFHSFDLEGIEPCTERSGSDYLDFSMLPGVNPCPSRRCGRFAPQEVVSEGPYFKISFRSNGQLDGRGFVASYWFLNETDLPKWALEYRDIGTSLSSSVLVTMVISALYGMYVMDGITNINI